MLEDPELQTLAIRTNMAAKKTSVCQSILLMTSNLLELKRMMGRAGDQGDVGEPEFRTMPSSTVVIFNDINIMRRMNDARE